jgi:type I restriction enzyme S subunit
MKEVWEIKKLGDLFEITSSKRVFESEWKRDGVPFYRAREIVKLAKHGFVDNELFISEEMFNQYSAKYGIPAEGDMMVTGVGTLGVCYVVQKHDRFYFKDGNIIWLKKKTETDSRFVEYAFQSDYLRKQIDDSVGATVGTYTIVKAKNTLIPLPPLPEQERIVGILDEAFDGIAIAKANAEKNLQNARALFESHLEAILTRHGQGWAEEKLGDLCQVKTGKKDVNEGNPKGAYPFFTCATAHTYSDSYSFDTEALLVAGNGAVGQVSYYSGKFEAYQRTYVLCGFNDVLARYLFRVLDGRLSKTVAKQKLGNTMPYIKIGMLTDFVVPIPPVREQQRLVEELDTFAEETRRLESKYKQKVAALEGLKKSLLHEAFSGQL